MEVTRPEAWTRPPDLDPPAAAPADLVVGEDVQRPETPAAAPALSVVPSPEPIVDAPADPVVEPAAQVVAEPAAVPAWALAPMPVTVPGPVAAEPAPVAAVEPAPAVVPAAEPAPAVVEVAPETVETRADRGSSAYRWSFISLFVRVALQAISGIVIARELGPKAFGTGMLIVSIYVVVAGFVVQGSNGTLIIRRVLPRSMVRGILALDIGLGVLGALGFVVAALLTSGTTRAGLLVAAVGCLVVSITGPGYALSSRALRFGRISAGEIIGSIAGTTVAIVISSTTHSLIALPVQMVVIDVGICLLVLRSLTSRPEPLGADARTDVGYRYGLQTAGNQLASVGARNADNYLVAGLMGQTSLGLYVLAYRLMMLPVQNIAMVLTRVLVPRLRHLAGDERATEAEVRGLILAIALPVGAVTGAFLPFADHVMVDVFGHRYDGAIDPTRVLLLATFPQCMINVSSCVFAAAGHGRTQLALTSTSLGFAVIAVLAGQHWGIVGITVVYCALAFVLAVVSVQQQTRFDLVSWRPFAEGLRFFVVVVLVCGALSVAWRVGLPGSGLVASLLELVVAGVVGSVVAGAVQRRSAAASTRFWIDVAKGTA